ncbi:SDR family oxidoreductase [Pseudomonas sp. ADAK18]|uniref:SDR family NAD(P)-dependent oxidoreductase n=1 Tax=Pseudomonas sp. ADAK18 TaxID=2730848 RepID=UPI0014635CC7|nr:SDR family NAD(P)-dependent oxidoreductase [Pseudomonas sp. ADAK18]QJI31087.1 SDR family oxidoreductase [Pseudomonas sp. ADAK18]
MTELRIAVVSGGTRGIGLTLSRRLISLGYRVIALYQGDADAARQAEMQWGDALVAIQVNVSDPDAVRAVADQIITRYGVPQVLVNNAGVNRDRPFLELTDEDWSHVIGVNLSGPFYLTRAFAPAMLEAGRGSVVNIGATTGIRPRLDGANYCASKAGLLHLTKCLALELAPVIRVNCLIPGMTDTEELRTRFHLDDRDKLAEVLAQIPQRRLGSTEDIAAALEFLIGAQSSYLTGQKLIVDGGQFMW